jgi:hypothetical protein
MENARSAHGYPQLAHNILGEGIIKTLAVVMFEIKLHSPPAISA